MVLIYDPCGIPVLKFTINLVVFNVHSLIYRLYIYTMHGEQPRSQVIFSAVFHKATPSDTLVSGFWSTARIRFYSWISTVSSIFRVQGAIMYYVFAKHRLLVLRQTAPHNHVVQVIFICKIMRFIR